MIPRINQILSVSIFTYPKGLREEAEVVFVENLKKIPIGSSEDAYVCLKKGLENRHVGSTQMNEQSSRSHSVFTINVKQTQKGLEDVVKTSKLNLIDLSGTERQTMTKSEGKRLNDKGCVWAFHSLFQRVH